MILRIKNWSSFQHYKNRRPPWIKLHRTTLDDRSFHKLPVDSRALAPMLWLIASDFESGIITESAEDIAWRLRMSVADVEHALKPLIDKGFVIQEQESSEALASRKQEDHPEKEKREEKETEGDGSFTPLEAARGFLIDFQITGDRFLYAAEKAIALRAQLSKVKPQDACDQLRSEYRSYIDSRPEFKKGADKWLGECNQNFQAETPERKWRPVQ
jgi:hypothetical protein